MSNVSSREKTMLLVAVVAVLYAIAGLSYKKQVANWKRAERIYDTAQKKVAEERALIAARDEWTARYETMRGLMPVFPYDQDVATYWMSLMESAATRNSLTLSRRQAGKEEEVGDVYELPIDCKGWEGTLESLVKFLYDLQKEGAMLDVRQLFVQPISGRPGFLRGSFILTCAYMRGDESKAKKTQPQSAAPDTETAADAPTNTLPEAAESALPTQSVESAEAPTITDPTPLRTQP